MTKRLNYFLLGILVALVAMLWFAAPARAEYQMSEAQAKQLVATMEAGTRTVVADGVVIHVGETYKQGQFAAFGVRAEGFVWHLQEWDAQGTTPDGREIFRVTYWWFREDGAKRAVSMFSGRVVESLEDEHTVEITSPEVIAASELTQQFLKRAGRQL